MWTLASLTTLSPHSQPRMHKEDSMMGTNTPGSLPHHLQLPASLTDKWLQLRQPGKPSPVGKKASFLPGHQQGWWGEGGKKLGDPSKQG